MPRKTAEHDELTTATDTATYDQQLVYREFVERFHVFFFPFFLFLFLELFLGRWRKLFILSSPH